MLLSPLSRTLLLALALFSTASWVEDAVHHIRCSEAAEKLVSSVQLDTFPEAAVPPFDIQSHGTTTLAFRHNDSIIVCVDSKASMGNYVGSRTVKKVFPVAPRIVATMAGGAADCAYWIRAVSRQAKIIERKYATPMRTQGIARLLARQLRAYRGRDLSIGTMIAGHDCTGPNLYYVDSEGSCIQGSMFCVGSGAQSAYSVLDSCPPLATLALSDAVDAAIWAVRHATVRDGYSGGYLNVIQVNESGIFPLRRLDCRRLPMGLRDHPLPQHPATALPLESTTNV